MQCAPVNNAPTPLFANSGEVKLAMGLKEMFTEYEFRSSCNLLNGFMLGKAAPGNQDKLHETRSREIKVQYIMSLIPVFAYLKYISRLFNHAEVFSKVG